MAQIGTFTRNNDGFFGRIRTLTLDVEVTILPVDGDPAENAPNHRMFADGLEVGAAWDRTGTGRDAKFYRLTRKGRLQLEHEIADWRRLAEGISLILSATEA